MPTKKTMLIDPFSANRSDSELSQMMENLRKEEDYSSRLQRVSTGKTVLLDRIEKEQGYWLLNFGLLKREGPGVAEPEKQIRSPKLDRLSYATETAMLFRPKSKQRKGVILIQFSQLGVRAGMIARFFSWKMGKPSDYLSLQQVMLDNAKERATARNQVKTLICAAAPESFDKIFGEVGSVETLELKEHVERIEIHVIPHKESRGIAKWLKWARKKVNTAVSQQASKLILLSRDHEDDEWDRINIFDYKERLKQQIELPDSDYRESGPAEIRWDAMKRALEEYDRQV